MLHSGRPLLPPLSPKSAQQLIRKGIASGPALKLFIPEEGWYRLTAAELQAVGFTTADPRYLQVYAEGVEQAIAVTTSLTGKDGKETGDYALEFFATAIDTPSTDTRVYWLLNGKQPNKRIQVHQK